MSGPIRIDADAAARLIGDGWTVASAGFVGCGHAEHVTHAIERRFLATGAPRGLTLVYSAGQGDVKSRGVNHFGHAGLVRRIVGGHWKSAPKLAALALAGEVEAYNLPQGIITQLYRAIAGGKPGVITRIGLNTFVDPRHGGGRLNARARDDLVELIDVRGEEHLLYPAFPIHCTLLRGTTADARGNITTEHEAFHHELLAIAQAARNSGGIVIAQVKRVVERHANPNLVRVPGILVDYVVVCEDPAEHWMTFQEEYNPAYTGEAPPTDAPVPVLPLDARKIVQRRAVLELAARRPKVVNLGVGMPANVGTVAREEGVSGFTMTVEAGPIGGVPAERLSFGASAWPEAIVDQPAQFDFYDGGGIDMAFLGLAELDAHGNVNVSMFGEGGRTVIAGVGGFINITQSARRLVFMGTLTAGGLEVAAADGRLTIVREGRYRKIVPAVSHLTFNGPYVAGLGRAILYVTERAVFELRDGRLTLVEIAPGMDLARDVLAQCGTDIAVAHDLRPMDPRIFTDAPMGLARD
jgi:propionate CoA-transferase